jgi:ElaB/YqjD/DUF883 family membrane-anchored ribosome-binding protein
VSVAAAPEAVPKERAIMNHVQASERKAKIHETSEEAAGQLRERVEHVRDIVENVRDKAELAVRDRPYLVPVAAGAVGLGIGVLLGSKLTRLVLFTAVGALRRLASQFMGELQNRLSEGEAEGEASTSAAE